MMLGPIKARKVYRNINWLDLWLEGNSGNFFQFWYLSQGENPLIDGVDDRAEFSATQDAFRLLGFSEKEQNNIFRILAGILQLGNINIEAGEFWGQFRQNKE